MVHPSVVENVRQDYPMMWDYVGGNSSISHNLRNSSVSYWDGSALRFPHTAYLYEFKIHSSYGARGMVHPSIRTWLRDTAAPAKSLNKFADSANFPTSSALFSSCLGMWPEHPAPGTVFAGEFLQRPGKRRASPRIFWILFDYRVIYQVSGSNVYVFCVLDGRRDIASILDRRILS